MATHWPLFGMDPQTNIPVVEQILPDAGRREGTPATSDLRRGISGSSSRAVLVRGRRIPSTTRRAGRAGRREAARCLGRGRNRPVRGRLHAPPRTPGEPPVGRRGVKTCAWAGTPGSSDATWEAPGWCGPSRFRWRSVWARRRLGDGEGEHLAGGPVFPGALSVPVVTQLPGPAGIRAGEYPPHGRRPTAARCRDGNWR